jgi:hypothetical protein
MFRWLRRLLHREHLSDEVRARSRVSYPPLMLHKYSSYRGMIVAVPLARETPLDKPAEETRPHD